MQGCLDFLLSPAAVALRAARLVLVIPMLNPDGVANGSYRCGLGGVDLNRQWSTPARCGHATVHAAKRLLQVRRQGLGQRLEKCGRREVAGGVQAQSTVGVLASASALSARPVRAPWVLLTLQPRGEGRAGGLARHPFVPFLRPPPLRQPSTSDPHPNKTSPLTQDLPDGQRATLFVDLHGHSTRESTFCYGCEPPAGEGGGGSDRDRAAVRLLPHLLAREEPSFALPRCHWRVARAKAAAGRVVAARELGIAASYTLETSLAGDGGSRCHYGVRELLRVGEALGRAIAVRVTGDHEALLAQIEAGLAAAGGKEGRGKGKRRSGARHDGAEDDEDDAAGDDEATRSH